MSGREKRKDEEGASDGDSEGHAPPKKNLKRSSDEDSDEIIVCDLSKNRRVKVRNFQGRIMIDIREFYVKDGKELPGKKVCLGLDWCLRVHVSDIVW
ncbi:RNA polymerase II transcriptional coactivator KIWI isoform X3 [Ziziphus jujuba]|uniref:RNA polymerase II transcriptional coactivator KIWI isoform X3 n=1 Tax=Ziziphus jujuba TaxID=326968 RepID=A0ABM3IUZ7_ZIZJJ|nr:RNA polymerase II transcriptional coactivator KIWI isoform X3 [Ziziphus jujuba]